MGVIMHNDIPYGGGSTIEPNPQESATEQLETLGIDGDVYEVTDANAIHTSDVGVANGVAELDANGKVPSSQLPSYVDDVLEYASISAFPATGETGKIYVALDTNLTYRWGGSDYVEISPSLALGETSSTAYRGDRGKIAYDHSQSDHSGIKPAFTEASTRANIASGESFATILGKIKKFFSDLKTVAFTGAYSDLSGTPTIPTKTSDLTNDSGFVTTDEKVTGEEKNWDAGYWMNVPFIGTSNQKPYYNDGQRYYTKNGTSSAVGRAILAMGNSTASGTAGNKRGELWLYGENNRTSMLRAAALTGDREVFLPDKGGTIALTSDIVNTKVTQNASTTDKWRKVLLHFHEDTTGGSAVTEGTDIAYGAVGVSVQPSTGTLKASSLISDGAINGDFKNQRYVNLASLDANTWYPVTGTPIAGYNWGMRRLAVHVALNSSTKPSWSTHQRGFSVDLDVLATAGGWGTSIASTIVLTNTFTWVASNEPSPAGYSQMQNSSTPVFWLRGGGNYYIYTDYPCEWTVRTSTYTASSQSVAPTTTYPGISISSKSTVHANLEGTAYRSQITDQVNNWYSTRPTSADVAGNNFGGLRKFLSTSSMSTNKPTGDGHIIHLDWDNGGDNCAQLFVPRQSTNHMQYRSQGDGTTWPTTWTTLIDSNNISSQSVDQATKDGDGNTISSTYAKNASVYKSAVSDSKSSWTAGEGWFADTIGPETKGVYVFIGWAEFDGSLGGRRGIKLARHNSSSTVMASAFTSESADSGYPRTVTCVEYVTCGTDAAVSLAWRRLRLYTANNLSSGTIKGGVIMIKISDL